MPKDVVIIPSWDRPEYLAVCLACIATNPEAKDMHYIFALDYGFNRKALEVIDNVMQDITDDYQVNEMPDMHFGDAKQSYNVLNAYYMALQMNPRYVFLIEDDIFIGKGFFKAMYQIQEQEPECFCVIGSRNNNPMPDEDRQNMNVSTYRTTMASAYQSWGVCWNSRRLDEAITHHYVKGEYFKDMRGYCQRLHPNSRIQPQFCEQDGLISRMHELSGRVIAYPDYPRCFHAGVYGYHRQAAIQNASYESKLKFILNTCFDPEKMEKYNQYNDVFVADLSVDDDIV